MSALEQAKSAAPYGIKAIRQMRRKPAQSARLAKKKHDTFQYFLEKVDPVIGSCITHMLREQPTDVPNAMIDYFTHLKETGSAPTTNDKAREQSDKPKREMKLYLATSIGPVVSKLLNRVALTLPENVLDFMCEELKQIISENASDSEPLPASFGTSTSAAAVAGKKYVKVSTSATVTHPTTTKTTTAATTATTATVTHSNNQEEGKAVNSSTYSSAPPAEQKSAPAPAERRTIQIAVIGMGGAGKTSIINTLQGKIGVKTKPTIGFRPISLMLGEQAEVRLYDLGGGKKIRGIWDQYYHDVHGVIYVVDAALHQQQGEGEREEEQRAECLQLFAQSMSHRYLAGKPLLMFANKQDVEGAATVSEIADAYLPLLARDNASQEDRSKIDDNILVKGCSNVLPTHEDDTSASEEEKGGYVAGVERGCGGPEEVESGIEKLLKVIIAQYDSLHERVTANCKEKAQEEKAKRLQRERRVLKNKIASAFFDSLDPELKAANDAFEADPGSVFDVEEGLTFLASEIGEDVEGLCDLAVKAAALVGYQRLALQMIGALKSPISKKKEPLEWEEIVELLMELRLELGLPASP